MASSCGFPTKYGFAEEKEEISFSKRVRTTLLCFKPYKLVDQAVARNLSGFLSVRVMDHGTSYI